MQSILEKTNCFATKKELKETQYMILKSGEIIIVIIVTYYNHGASEETTYPKSRKRFIWYKQYPNF